jgi:minor extracellular serine protease Vpr
MKTYRLASLSGAMALVIMSGQAAGGIPADRAERFGVLGAGDARTHVTELMLAQPVYADAGHDRISAELLGAVGTQQVFIRLSAEPVARGMAAGRDKDVQRRAVNAQQNRFLAQTRKIDKKVLGQPQVLLNGIFAEVDAEDIATLAANPEVSYIVRVGNYQLDLAETVPYIGAAAVQSLGYDGTGVRVAVLDSGIDYLHAAFGGSGDPADFANNDPTIIEPGTFPTAKVVGGYDFVGSVWPSGPLMPDPDPLDDGPEGGHGTNVADIIAGANGVAPGADLYAVKVCSSVSTSCSGVALIQGMEFAVDPNGDGDFSDRADIINMSLGSVYGQAFDHLLSYTVDSATKLGVLTVASAGNSADKPYITGTPAAATTALSVAQTAVPSAKQDVMEIVEPASIAGRYEAVFQAWSVAPTDPIEALVQYGDGAGGNLLGCDPFAPGSLAGKIVLIDRGACNFTRKAATVSEGGGLVAIIGLVSPEAPFSGADGGDRPIDIPSYMIRQADSNRIKSGLPLTVVRFDPAAGISLAGSVVGTSSRGPRNPDSRLKPEIGAPGASVSADAGTGTGTRVFGGTSGAAPMVAGSAALVLGKWPGLSPAEVKARLMNTGETNIANAVTLASAPLAPVSRIGGGEVRADRALMSDVAAWDDAELNGALSLQFFDVEKDTAQVQRRVRLRNYGNRTRTFSITPTFRFANDEASGALEIKAPKQVRVQAGRDAIVPVTFAFKGANLPGNFMNSGSAGNNPATLTLNEYDGYLVFDDGEQPIHLAWHVLPRRAANVVGRTALNTGGIDEVELTNNGVGTAQLDGFALVATSPRQAPGGPGEQSPTPDLRAVGVNTFPGACGGTNFLWEFAINTWERQSHLLPVSFLVYLDINQDGIDDFVVLNRDLSGLGTISDGRQVSWVVNLATGAASAFFFAEHATNSANTVLRACGSQLGLTAADLLNTNVNMDVIAQDFYFGGPGDFVGGITVTPFGERFVGFTSDIPGKSSAVLPVADYGLFPGNSPELGLMVITNGGRGAANNGGATKDTETLLLIAK